MNDLEVTIKSTALQTAIQAGTGQKPKIRKDGGKTILYFSEPQQKVLRQQLENQLNKKSGQITVEVAPIINPLILKKALPYLVATIGIGYIVGKL